MSSLSERIDRVKQHDAEKADLFEVKFAEDPCSQLTTYSTDRLSSTS